jgi:mannose-1-phosphate guanylyltransferase / mannose-6-phosphate isomerase
VSVIRPVFLSGGSGTRLWPLSTPDLPKQFADLLPGVSLFVATVRRMDGVDGAGSPLVVTGERHLDLVRAALEEAGTDALVLVEPEGRNTAPAVTAAALAVPAEDVLVILPSDHIVSDEEAFRSRVVEAARLARSGAIVTFGVVPTRPDTGYGYIELGEPIDGARRVARFKEKPAAAEAESFLANGRHLWNSGMFVASAGTVLDEVARLRPDLLSNVTAALGDPTQGVIRLGAPFAEVEAISFDHAVMEGTDRGLVVPLEAGWDDVGSFRALHSHSPQDEAGNATTGRVVVEDATDSLVIATSRVVAVAGVHGMAVVETPDAVLVVPLDRAQEVRELADRAENV